MSTPSTRELERLLRLGVALSAERNLPRLLCRIVGEAQSMTDADGGTLYLLGEDERSLDFAIIRNRSLGIAVNACGEVNRQFEPVPLVDESGEPNHGHVAAHVALTGKPVVIDDVYDTGHGYDIEGVRRFDARHGYRTRSLLSVPMRDHEETVIGVLQLVNRIDGESQSPVPFRMRDILLAEALASQAAVTLTNRRLIQGLEDFIDAFVRVIATAIDEKNPHTANHCKRVPAITLMLAEAVSRTEQGPLADFRLSDRDRREIELAAWLHDCGKIATPEYILDKATKLHTLYDRIGLIETRFAALRSQLEIEHLRSEPDGRDGDDLTRQRRRQALEARLAELDEALDFLRQCNRGTEFMDEADRERVREIGRWTWIDHEGRERPLLTDDEIECLTIPKGTLTPREREIINNHIVVTQRMLEQLPFPKHLRNIPEYAGGHHERVDGKGYPRGLTREQLSVPARIMAIADVFEALTDRDRPYKTGKTLSEALDILRRMRDDGHIDPDLFEVFVRERVYLEYAREYLDESQIDLDESAVEAEYPNIKLS